MGLEILGAMGAGALQGPLGGPGSPTLGQGAPAGGAGGAGSAGGAGEPGGDFGAALKQAIGALAELGATADASALQFAAGGPVDVHELMLAMEHASLGFQAALQVRNKLVDAYQEIMRMSL